MKRRLILSSLLTLAILALAACGSPTAIIDESRVAVTWDDPGIDEVQISLSNQSSDDTEARLSVEVDGVVVIDQVFETGDYHNFHAFNVNEVAPGEHTVVLRSSSGHEVTKTFEKADAPLWIGIGYWGAELGPGFDFMVSDEPIEYA